MVEIQQFISTVGFPIFVAVFMLVKGSRDNEKVTQALTSLEIAINNLCKNCKVGGTNDVGK